MLSPPVKWIKDMAEASFHILEFPSIHVHSISLLMLVYSMLTERLSHLEHAETNQMD